MDKPQTTSGRGARFGGKALTAAQRKTLSRRRMAAAGLVEIMVKVPELCLAYVDGIAALDDKTRSEVIAEILWKEIERQAADVGAGDADWLKAPEVHR